MLSKQPLTFSICFLLLVQYISHIHPSHPHTDSLHLIHFLSSVHVAFSCCVYHSTFSRFLILQPPPSLFFLVFFEVLNNERASLPGKFIGNFKLKLYGTEQPCRILSSGSHRGVEEAGSRGLVRTQRQSQQLHAALILQVVTVREFSIVHKCCESFGETVAVCFCCSDYWTLMTVHFLT